MIEKIKEQVALILDEEESGHGMDHIERVYNLAIKFAKEEQADIEIVSIASLLHDVDDYKIVGKENAEKLTNAMKIMNSANISKENQEKVIEIIKNMGYSKSLKGIRPITIEGMCVSDADMCDIMGAIGVIRTINYHLSSKENKQIFNRANFPKTDFKENYLKSGSDSAINHFFDKMLKLKNLMMTSSGKKEALIRHKFMVTFLREFFREEDIPKWKAFLENYLKENR